MKGMKERLKGDKEEGLQNNEMGKKEMEKNYRYGNPMKERCVE